MSGLAGAGRPPTAPGSGRPGKPGVDLASATVSAQPAASTPDVSPEVPWYWRLSFRLLGWTVLFVMLAEVLIFVPSVARERLNFLEATVMDADLATLSLQETPKIGRAHV